MNSLFIQVGVFVFSVILMLYFNYFVRAFIEIYLNFIIILNFNIKN